MPSLHESSDPNRTFSAVDSMSQEALSHYYNSLRSESGYGSESYASEQEEEPEEDDDSNSSGGSGEHSYGDSSWETPEYDCE